MQNLLTKCLASIVFASGMYFSIPLSSQLSNSNNVTKKLEQLPSTYFFTPGLEYRICTDSTSGDLKKNNVKDKYALLITGSNENRFKNDISEIYKILQNNGFKNKDILILDEKGVEDSAYYSDGILTKKSLKRAFSYFERKIDSKDVFVVHISGHGDRNLSIKEGTPKDSIDFVRSYFNTPIPYSLGHDPKLPDSVLNNIVFEELSDVSISEEVSYPFQTKLFANVCPTEKDLDRYLSKINPDLGILTTTTCYGGGIAKRLGKNNFIAISNSKEDEVAYLIEGHSFGLYFYKSFLDDSSDINSDCKTTIDEAFNYARTKILNPPGDPIDIFRWTTFTKPTTPLLIYDKKCPDTISLNDL